MSRCLVCKRDTRQFISFGRMPIANGFLSPEEFAREYFFELTTVFCPSCEMVQLGNLVKREKMFHGNYAFFSSTSVRMAQHFKVFADHVKADYLGPVDPFVVEIGSNDGIMLQHFAHPGLRHLGVEPSENVARAGMEKGIRTVCRFFDEQLAREIVAEHGHADAVLGANVMCHIPDLHSVAAGVKLLLKPQGVLVFEDPYLGDIVEKTSYDQIYDEHAFYFSVGSVSRLFEPHGLEVVDVQPQNVHGGSMRYVIAHRDARPVSAAVRAQRAKEKSMGLGSFDTYLRFARNVERSREDLMAMLRDLKSRGSRVVGYGATSKSTTVINYCGIKPDLVEFISDTTPIKLGKFSPGAHIPIRPHAEFAGRYPPHALLFAWNHAEEIMAKETAFRSAGGKWIVYVPEVAVL